MKKKDLFILWIVTTCFFLGTMFYAGTLSKKIETLTSEKDSALTSWHCAESELKSVYEELDAAMELVGEKSVEIDQLKEAIENEEAKWRRRYEEYPEATEAWIAMKNLGWSDTVCAGIMGNLMAETGGTGTLYLDWDSNGCGGYGLVQWIGGRRTDIKTKYGDYPTIKEQIQFMYDELYGTNGVRLQVTEAQRDKIQNAETPEECAYAFACYYERCATSVRSMRKGFARTAYEYFAT